MCIRDHNASLTSNWFLIYEAGFGQRRNARMNKKIQSTYTLEEYSWCFDVLVWSMWPVYWPVWIKLYKPLDRVRHVAQKQTLPSVSLGSDAGDFDACIGELVRFRVLNLVCAWNDVRFIEWSAGSLKGTYVPLTWFLFEETRGLNRVSSFWPDVVHKRHSIWINY